MMGEPSGSPPDRWEADSYQRDAGFVSAYGAAVLDELAPQPGERILDLGCGDGSLTAQIAAAGATVVGIDASASMIDAARARGLDARVLDGHALDYDAAFDAAFSNAAMHWMLQPQQVADGVARALKPGARFVAEMGGHGNIAAIRTALIAVMQRHNVPNPLDGPWYFPTEDEHRAVLQEAGFTVRSIVRFGRPTPVAAGLSAWLDIFAEPFFERIGEEAWPRVRSETVEMLAPALRDTRGNWTADYVRLRFHAVKAS